MQNRDTAAQANSSTALLLMKLVKCYMSLITIASQEEQNIYYVVTAQLPIGGKRWEVGCYLTEALARRVAAQIADFNEDTNIHNAGRLKIAIEKYQGEMIKTNQFIRLKNTPAGCITLIEEEANLGCIYDARNPVAGHQTKLDLLRSSLIDEAIALNNKPVMTVSPDCNLLRNVSIAK